MVLIETLLYITIQYMIFIDTTVYEYEIHGIY